MKRSVVPFSIISVYLFALVTSVFGDDTVYQWQEQERTHFSDRPHPNAKVIPIKTGYSYYTVSRVMDGDTIQLEDTTKIRLLGINTPEVGGRYKSTEAGGEQAKLWLKQQLLGKKIRLETDVENHDKYKRSLAYIFTQEGVHINQQLVRNGLASLNIFPPNLKYVRELSTAEQQAQQEKLGIWNNPAYAVKAIDQIDNLNQSGWQRLSGTAQSIHKTSRYVYLEFSDQFTIRIARANLYLFPELESYLGHRLEVRGWVNEQQDGFSMLIRHPHAIKVLI